MLRRRPIHSAIRLPLIAWLLVIAFWSMPWHRVSARSTQDCDSTSGQIVLTSVPSTLYHKPVAVSVYLPPCYDSIAVDDQPLYPVIYLLHGGGADETQWPDLNVQLAADSL